MRAIDYTMDEKIREAMKPIKICPLCGENNIKTKVSFKGRSLYRNKKEIEWWLNNGQLLAEKENYTVDQINEYRQYVLICAELQKLTKIETK